ncbi:IS5 family transposase [Teredinibacter turnerae]|uniref:IS5 family transposase n=1 Tax=Teredinibacter turnerae TaxID=2426 RepID=UPI00037D115F|nr:IS5 family transposase [Teredinibacter turnerae]
MSQLTFSEAEYNIKKRKTRREKFLERMEGLIPWEKLEQQLAKKYSRGKTGRKPYPLNVMLRVHVMQLLYNLSDPAMEDALYEIESMRRFAGLRLSDNLPDETTILNFRHFLESHKFGQRLFDTIQEHLASHGLRLQEGSIIDASIISAPTSTKNKEGKRDPEMHQTKKGNEWHFGMKMHIGVDESLGLIHSISTTAANEHDIVHADKLLHGKEKRVWGDAGYVGIDKRDENKDRDVDWFIAMRPGKRAVLAKSSEIEQGEKAKASVRAKVEHAFSVIKQRFGYSKVRYRGLAKNTDRLYLLAGFTNLLRAEKYLPA